MSTKLVEKKDRREGRGRVIAISRNVYRMEKTDVYYVESESKDGMYYYVMFDTVKNYEWCSCKDFENHKRKCKHLFAVEYAIMDNVVKNIDKLSSNKQSWKDDEYSF